MSEVSVQVSRAMLQRIARLARAADLEAAYSESLRATQLGADARAVLRWVERETNALERGRAP